ncbi:hypothetical protein P154DRAFT_192135 [Amniculicola lignicola CBS 123094]|uniref:Autophagy protein n=1 Tax=Amniculicola lignicola CBS 123094 TaxID=1392246 RepID=A0A6A5WSU7_9PLEO|nr:hypothetical protein P154DRAFT_192135 [Amniculicola lignicola CBS 123094]
MGWLWNDAPKDQLDPSLRDFLKHEAPSSQKPALPALPSKPADRPPPSAPAPDHNPSTPPVPPQSQFQDGRYAHLWKGYTPQNVLENRGKSEQDRLKDIVDHYKDRRGDVGRVAMENCALEYMAQFECYRNPSWAQIAVVCRTESRRFNRCYDLQQKFLKALGYFTLDERSPEESERIQMHADKLYQQLMDQERQIEEAIEQKKPIPQFESVLSKQNISRAMTTIKVGTEAGKDTGGQSLTGLFNEEDVWAQVKPEARQTYEQQIADLPPLEQETERRAILAELQVQNTMAKRLEVAFVEERISRLKRKESGQATVGDTIKRWWGWDQGK